MLKLLFGMTPLSRPGCRAMMGEALDGLEIRLPEFLSSPPGGWTLLATRLA